MTSINLNENLLENIIYRFPGNVYWSDKYGVYFGCNQNVADIFGLQSPTEIIGKTIFDLLPNHPELAKKVSEEDKRIIDNNQERLYEETAVDSKGQDAIYLTRKSPLKKNGKIIGIIGISIDITYQKKAEQLEFYNKELKKYTSIIAHDICSPLYCVSSLTDLIYKDEAVPAKYRDIALKIKNTVNDVTNLATDLLNIAKIESGKMKIQKQDLAVEAILEDVLSLQENTAQSQQMNIIRQYDIKQPHYISSERKLLLRILTNLISNAIKYSPSQQDKRIWVGVKSDTDHIYVTIQDEGYGIKDIKEAVEPFNMVDTPSSSEVEKIGLGLYSAKQLIEKIHQGQLLIESEVDKGTCITCVFPKQ